jgi:eukaryotic-like serine/threonine-protein kinase
MALKAGTRFGPYEVTALLGAGGMGEVYRARDPRLGRDVALKILPAAFVSDPDRLARFQREAQVLASLNHPGIAAIYGFEESGNARALILELVEGPTLAERLAEGPLPIEDALQAASAIAAALEAAHEQGIVHRDLKPANIKVSHEGFVKVLDFGLAKALDPTTTPGINADQSPTITAHATRSGIILGTAAYMAPEQAKGKPVDRRADIWAFGVVLYEMLTGHRLFEGETPSEVLAAVILKSPDLKALPEETPAHVRHLLARCLDKDPKRRLRDIGEARLALADPGTLVGPAAAGGAGTASPFRSRLVWLAAGLGLALVVVLILWGRSLFTGNEVARYDIQPPPKTTLGLVNRPAVALSRDGSMLMFVAYSRGVSRIYLRRRGEGEARPLPGTEGGSCPVFSPDGRWIAFFSGNVLKKAVIDGSPVDLAKVNDPRGLVWSDAGSLIYAPEANGPLHLLPAGGGIPRPVTTLDTARDERSHRWPEALPGGKTVLFTIGLNASVDNYDTSAIAAVDLVSEERRTILEGASMVRYLPGYLTFTRAGVLYAVGFDPKSLEIRGTPVPMVPAVSVDTPTGAAHYSCAEDGTLAYVPGSSQSGRALVWVDRSGAVQPLDLPPQLYNDVRLSPDGRRAAVAVGSSGDADIWLYDFTRKTFTRLTFDTTNATPTWSADGRSILYSSIDGSASVLRRVPADGSRPPEELGKAPSRAYFGKGPRDGAWAILAYSNLSPASKTDVVRRSLEPDAKPLPIAATQFDEYTPSVSPDGRWVAYQSDDTGRDEVYVRDASGSGARWQVSNQGGNEPNWSADGRELFYRSEGQLMAVGIGAGPVFAMGAHRVLFDGVYDMRSDTGLSYDVAPDGEHFLMIRPASDHIPVSGIRIVLHWLDEVQHVTAGGR